MAQALEADLPSQEILRLTLKEEDKPPKRSRIRNKKVSKYIEKVLEYSCDVCGKEFNDKYNLHTHSKIHLTTYAYQCSTCPYKSKTQKYLSRHIKKVHNKPTAHKCRVCGKMFHYPSKLKTHMLVHTGEKPYKCDVCGKAFNASYTLSTHKFIHTNEKPFQCSFCDYACRDSSTLRKHQARHMGLERVYQCKLCTISCKSKWMLKNHVAEKHLEIQIKKYTCDLCGKVFKLRNNLTNHIKAIHEKSKMCSCKICGHQLTNMGNLASHMRTHVDARPYKCTFEGCHKGFKSPAELKKHAATHAKRRRPLPRPARPRRGVTSPAEEPVDVKEERSEVISEEPIDLFEVEKQELLDDSKDNEVKGDGEDMQEYSEGVLSEDMARAVIRSNRQRLNLVPEQVFDHFFIGLGVQHRAGPPEKKDKICVDLKEENNMKECVKELLHKHQKRAQKRQRIERVSTSRTSGREARGRRKIKTNNGNIENISSQAPESNDVTNRPKIDKPGPSATENNEIELRDRVGGMSTAIDTNVEKKQQIIMSTATRRKKGIATGSGNTPAEELKKTSPEALNKSCNVTEDSGSKIANGRLKLNTHQCYICFKLFDTKPKLTQHCSEHFDICSEKMLKKCPVCKYVTEGNVKRHLRLVHQVDVNLAGARLQVREDNPHGSRYCYEMDNGLVLELIPSVNNLNKRASTRLDQQNRRARDNFIGTTKLVRNGREWVVEKKRLDRKEYVLPESLKEDCQIDNYLEKMKFLSRVAKKNGSKMLFPCNNCEKICQTLSGLKLHSRRHESNPKPFKAKVWKHKTKDKPGMKEKTQERIMKSGLAKPKPIVNRHKCDDKLKEFYENNITGGNIEFWHFLKIYNKMGRENVKDFKDLEQRTDFGIHPRAESDDNEKVIKNKIRRTNVKNKQVFKRVIMLSKRDYLKRKEAKIKLREKIYNEMHNKPVISN